MRLTSPEVQIDQFLDMVGQHVVALDGGQICGTLMSPPILLTNNNMQRFINVRE